ncbi:MAG TPA: hypothetical protein VFQ53_02195 [Kofleriaceae bacterium]|nr:hypothetical protein [Kofleriaceae bacterium]
MRGRCIVMVLGLVACGEPVLRNAPKPSTPAVAGAAAAVAGAATLAAPDAQARRAAEANKPSDEKKPVKSGPSVPSDVLDRLDHTGSGSGSGSSAAAKQPQPQPPLDWKPEPVK